MKTNVLLTLSYDGTNFYGYQVQPNKRTVQSELEKAIFSLTGETVKTVASGRTDSGVHAVDQKVNFITSSTIPAEKFCDALNVYLPSDVKVLKSKKVSKTFNARYSAKKKTYVYNCYFSKIALPLEDRYAVKIPEKVDVNLIKQGITILQGTNDYKCFLASGSSVKNTVRTIYKASVTKTKNGLKFTFTGNGFLYNMVRIMVGTLIEIGLKTKTVNDLKTALLTGNRKLVGKTMPPNGLTLQKVIY
ncbi:MAG: tRNA pseudouridine(38-40) synthase TruA [Clostridia bacterium]|nr:tRNA pseudouridine(38-40) synthase TruA [Clostridia bacterium]